MSMMTSNGRSASAQFFLLMLVPLAGISALWLKSHQSSWRSPRNHYLYLLGGTVAAALVLAVMPFLNGYGPWLAIGAGIAVYGYLERFRLLVTTGISVFLAGLLAAVFHVDVIGGALHLAAAAALAFASNRLHVMLHGRRREESDAAPDFIASFREYDADEPPTFWTSSKH